MATRKLLPVEEGWGKSAFCKGKDPDMWDLDTDRTYKRRGVARPLYEKGRRHCIRNCTVRVQCLRKALAATDPPTIGVVRGGVYFDLDQYRKNRFECLLCRWPIATQENGICWICHRYAQCLRCTRMVYRKPGMDSYYCKYCAD